MGVFSVGNGWAGKALFIRGCITCLLCGVLSACGGSGGGGATPGTGSGTPTPTVTVTPTPTTPPAGTLTLKLGAPSTSPIIVPPSAAASRVEFLAIASGTAYPEGLTLDELDSNGEVLVENVLTLTDGGFGVDVNRGDRTYTGSLAVSSVEAAEKYYRVRANNGGTDVVSGVSNFWVSGCPISSRPSNAQNVVDDPQSGGQIFSNEVMIQAAPGVVPDLDAINALVADVGGRVVGCIPALRQYLLEIPGDGASTGVYAAIDTLVAKNEIDTASPNAQILALPENESYECDGADCQWYLERIRAPQAWSIAGGGDEQLGVAVIDFGVDCNHPELSCDGDVFNQDIIDHGTGVASLIGAANADGTDIVGVAWNTDVFPYSFLGAGGSQYKMSELITQSLGEDNVKVINISAATAIDPNNQIRDAVCSAIDSGRLVVAAAGNAATANSCELESIYPAKYNTVGQCANGADLSAGLLVVGATDIDNNLAQWGDGQLCSNVLHADIYAPGQDIYTASSREQYAAKDGTSYATPLVAGSAAVVWASEPSLTVAGLHDRILERANTLVEGSGETLTNTSDERVSGRAVLDLYRALGGIDAPQDPDVTPDAIDLLGADSAVALNSAVESEVVMISGIDSTVPIDIQGGFYSIDGGPFTSAAGTIAKGQQLRVLVVSAQTPSSQKSAVLNVGEQSATFTVTTADANTAPDNFDFLDQFQVPLNLARESNVLTIPGIAAGTAITVDGGEYSLGGAAFTSVAGVVDENQTIQLRLNAADAPEAVSTMTVSIGGVEDSFSITTEDLDTSPTPFSFASELEVDLALEKISQEAVIEGINAAAIISISGGEYSINQAPFTSDAGEINVADVVRVRQTSAQTAGTSSFTTLTVGDYTATFVVSTRALDSTPEAFTFVDVANAGLGQVVESNELTITGINGPAPISLDVGEYRVNDGAYTAQAGIVVSGDVVTVRLTASPDLATTVQTTLTIGGVSDSFSVSTTGANIPDSFGFGGESDVPLGESVESSVVTITGLITAADITVSGGEYQVDGAAYTSSPGQISSNQTLRLRVQSSAAFNTSTAVSVTIAGVTESFNVTTLLIDTTPERFDLIDESSVPLNVQRESNVITVAGINAPSPISISGGDYRINEGAYVATTGTVNEGDLVQVRVTSSSTPESTTSADVLIGGVAESFTLTTIDRDIIPNAFAFTAQTGAALSAQVVSDAVTISGINAPAPISIAAGLYRINGGNFTSANGTISDGDRVEIQLRSAATPETQTTATLTIGGESAAFSVTTLDADTTPNAFSFAPETGVALSTAVISPDATISGINGATPISVVGGDYRVNGGSFTNSGGTVNNGDIVALRVLSSTNFSSATVATLTVGGVNANFQVTTEGADTTPNAFTFTDRGAQGGTLVTSNQVTIEGINAGTSISVVGGEYSVGSAAFTASPGTVSNGALVRVQVTSSATSNAVVNATLTVGGVSDTFSVTTIGDVDPDPFAFLDVTVPVSVVVTSSPVIVSGIDNGAPISIAGGEYSIAGGSYTSNAGVINNGQSVRVRLLSPAAELTDGQAVLTVGSFSDAFDVTTTDGPDNNIPVASILFPPQQSLTTGRSVTVRGKAADDTVVTRVTVNGVDASSSDNFATWSVTVPLAEGDNKLTVVSEDIVGNSGVLASPVTTIGTVALTPQPGPLAYDDVARVLYVADVSLKAIIAIDVASGGRRIVSGNGFPSANEVYGTVRDIVVDSANNRIIFINSNVIMAADITTGERTIISDQNTPDSTPLGSPVSLAIDVASNRAFASENNVLSAIDLTTGRRTRAFAEGVAVLRDMSYDSVNDRIFGLSSEGVLMVDFASGSQEQLDVGVNFASAQGIQYDELTEEAYVTHSREVYKLDFGVSPVAADVLSGPTIPNDTDTFEAVGGLALDLDNSRIFVADTRSDEIINVNSDSGGRTLFSHSRPTPNTGGVVLGVLWDIAFDQGRNRAIIPGRERTGGDTYSFSVDAANGARAFFDDSSTPDNVNALFDSRMVGVDAVGRQAIFSDLVGGSNFVLKSADLLTGQLTLLSSNTVPDTATPFSGSFNMVDMTIDTVSRRALLIDRALGTIVSVDLTSGVRTVVSDNTPPNDVNPIDINTAAILFDEERNRAILSGSDVIYALDLTSGIRTVLSDATAPGPRISSARDLAFDTTRDRILAIASSNLYSIDPVTGARELLSSVTLPNRDNPGVFFHRLEYDSANDRILIIDNNYPAVLAVDPETGSRVVLSH